MRARSYILIWVALPAFLSACSGSATSPSSDTSGNSSNSTTSTSVPGITANTPVSGVTFTGPAPGCAPASQGIEWVVTVSNPRELVRLYPHMFRNPDAGCGNTTHELGLMTVDGPLHYSPGQSGVTRFIYEPGRATCGRVEMGVILKNAAGEDTMLSWHVLNTGDDDDDDDDDDDADDD
jgi:hypothetical protein